MYNNIDFTKSLDPATLVEGFDVYNSSLSNYLYKTEKSFYRTVAFSRIDLLSKAFYNDDFSEGMILLADSNLSTCSTMYKLSDLKSTFAGLVCKTNTLTELNRSTT